MCVQGCPPVDRARTDVGSGILPTVLEILVSTASYQRKWKHNAGVAEEVVESLNNVKADK